MKRTSCKKASCFSHVPCISVKIGKGQAVVKSVLLFQDIWEPGDFHHSSIKRQVPAAFAMSVKEDIMFAFTEKTVHDLRFGGREASSNSNKGHNKV